MKVLRIFTLAIVISTLALSSTLFAATSGTDKKKVEQTVNNFIVAMNCENTGVVESAILISMELKSRYPEFNFEKVEDKLSSLAIDGDTPLIRYRAQLARLFYSNYSLFSDMKFEDKEYPEKTFRAIIDRLENINLASN